MAWNWGSGQSGKVKWWKITNSERKYHKLENFLHWRKWIAVNWNWKVEIAMKKVVCHPSNHSPFHHRRALDARWILSTLSSFPLYARRFEASRQRFSAIFCWQAFHFIQTGKKSVYKSSNHHWTRLHACIVLELWKRNSESFRNLMALFDWYQKNMNLFTIS